MSLPINAYGITIEWCMKISEHLKSLNLITNLQSTDFSPYHLQKCSSWCHNITIVNKKQEDEFRLLMIL